METNVSLWQLEVNGRKLTSMAPATKPLAHVLREQFGLIGTKVGCGQGECGACSVLIDDQLVCSCLTPICRAADKTVLTVEGIHDGDEDTLHPIQQAFIDNGALQCGFCTPGMVMSAFALLQKNVSPTRQDIVEALAGNICRCTGYQKIIEAILDAAARLRKQ